MESRVPTVTANKQHDVRGNLNLIALLYAGDIDLRWYTTHTYISMFAFPAADSALQAKFPFREPRNLCYNRAAAEEKADRGVLPWRSWPSVFTCPAKYREWGSG